MKVFLESQTSKAHMQADETKEVLNTAPALASDLLRQLLLNILVGQLLL